MNSNNHIYKFIGGKRNNKYCYVDKVYNEGDIITLPKHTRKSAKGVCTWNNPGELDKTITYIMVNGIFIIHNQRKEDK